MPGWLVLAIILFVLAALLALLRFLDRRSVARTHERQAAAAAEQPGLYQQSEAKTVPFLGWAAGVVAALGVVCVFVSSYNPVGTKEEGILTSFGATAGHLSAGPHLTWPWLKLHQMDAAIQTDTFTDDNPSDGKCAAIAVRIANQQTGCASVSFQWRIQPNAGDELYQDYRSFDHVRDALVTRRLKAAVNSAFAHYNPLDSIVFDKTKRTKQRTLAEFGQRVTEIMRARVGTRIKVISTIVPIITFDTATQSRINQLQQQVALTRIAEQEFQTNTKKAAANGALAKSVNSSPNVLVSRCLDTFEEMVKDHQVVPAGFSCWPGGSTLSGVIAKG